MKALATIDVVRWLPRLIAERRAIQARRAIDTPRFAAAFTGELSSIYLGAVARNAVVRWFVRLYWGLVRRLLRVPAVSDGPATGTTRL
jgi:hypothetical protein